MLLTIGGFETCIISYMKRVASPGSMHDTMLGAGALGRPRGMVQGGRKEGGFRMGTRVYLWQIHVDVWKTNIIL